MSETVTTAFPLTDTELTKVNTWASNGVNDIQHTVDDQIAQWKGEFILGAAAWDYLATGPGKDFVSNKMHLKAISLFERDSTWTLADTDYPKPTLSSIGLGYKETPLTVMVKDVRFANGTSHPIRVICQDADNESSDYFVHPWHLTKVETDDEGGLPSTTELEDARAEVSRLATALSVAEARHANDLDIISEVFWSEAERREWCDEAEAAMREINSRIHGTVRVERPVTSWRVRVDGPFGCGYVVFGHVEADDEDDAEEQVRAHLTSLSMIDLHDSDAENGRWGQADESTLYLSSSSLTFDVQAN